MKHETLCPPTFGKSFHCGDEPKSVESLDVEQKSDQENAELCYAAAGFFL